MKTFPLTLLCSAVLLSAASADDAQAPKTSEDKKPSAQKKAPEKKVALPFEDMKDNISYGIGLDFGQRIHRSLMRPLQQSPVKVDRKKLAASITLDKELVKNLRKRGLDIVDKRMTEGFQDALSGAKPRMNDAQLVQVFKAAQEQLIQARKQLGEKNKKEAKEFLAANKKKEGVKTTKSGLQYRVLKKGKGKSPQPSDVVVAHYKGTLLDGTVFDSSVERGVPFSFRVGGHVIKGWTEAVQLMKKGSKWKLFVPSKLAYAEQGRGADIGPHAVLIFELELLDINPKPKFRPKKAPPKRKPKKQPPKSEGAE